MNQNTNVLSFIPSSILRLAVERGQALMQKLDNGGTPEDHQKALNGLIYSLAGGERTSDEDDELIRELYRKLVDIFRDKVVITLTERGETL